MSPRCLVVVLLSLFALALPGGAETPAHAAGERLYREGILPSGAPLQGLLKGNLPAPGTAFACAGCHLRSGLGSSEGGVIAPSISGPKLFQPRHKTFPRITGAARERQGLTMPPLRPAYTEATLARALRTGIDPSGREFSETMPRYTLSDHDLKLLVGYLKTLSAQPSPGVDATTVRFATVIDGEVDVATQDAMLKPLQAFVAFHNSLSKGFGHRMYRSPAGQGLVQDHRTYLLVPWVLKGPRNTWRRQLETIYRKAPVFALLGGLSHGSWQPIHAFCEARHLPCILPLTDLPVVSDTDWYTLYFSKGYHQEGETAARFIANRTAAGEASRLVQVVQGEIGHALAAGFDETWRSLGRSKLRTLHLPDRQAITPGFLRDLLRRDQPTALLLWTDARMLDALQPSLVEGEPTVPKVISARYWQERIFELPAALRPTTFITYPFRHPQDETRALANSVTSLANQGASLDGRRIASRTYSLIQVLTKALMAMEGEFYRDHLLDRLGLLSDQTLLDFERLGFGPGQRYLSRGCYLMQLTPGADPILVKQSDWVLAN